MKRSLDHRLIAVKLAIKNKSEIVNPWERDLAAILNGREAEEPVRRAYDIHKHTYKKEVVESFLLAGSTPAEVSAALNMPEEVVSAYEYLFFDTGEFEDDLDRLEYAHTYKADKFGTELKRFAVDYGKSSLTIRMSRNDINVSPTLVQNEIRATAFLLAQKAKSNPVDSEVVKEALKWANLALKASANTEDEVHVSNVEELILALDTPDETTNEDKSGILADEILHSEVH